MENSHLRVGIFEQPISRSRAICQAMLSGIRTSGDRVYYMRSERPGSDLYDVAVFYGLSHGNRYTMQRHLDAGKKTLYIDLGYWDRLKGGRLTGYHKMVVNGIHPTEQMHYAVPDDRFNRYGKTIQERPQADAILLVGMQEKAAAVWGYGPNEWESGIAARLKEYTNRPILYRPKPNWSAATPIQYTEWSNPKQPLDKVLRTCHAVVSHHSNVGVDAMFHHVPAYAVLGPNTYLTHRRITNIGDDWLEEIDTVQSPDLGTCYKWLHKIAYCQWSVEEMNNGTAWRYYRENYLL